MSVEVDSSVLFKTVDEILGSVDVVTNEGDSITSVVVIEDSFIDALFSVDSLDSIDNEFPDVVDTVLCNFFFFSIRN